MSTDVAEAEVAQVEEGARRYRWTRAQYEHMLECGGFGTEDVVKIELLDGELWDVSPQGSRHPVVVRLAFRALQAAFGEGFDILCQFPIALDDSSEPEPDLAVVAGSPRDFLEGHPSKPLLLVEVSVTSLAFDRGRKLAAYARNGVPEYWIVDLNTEKLHVFREPVETRYGSEAVLGRGDTVTPLHAPEATIAVKELLP